MALEVARTIAQQIGNRAFMMVGAKDLLGDPTSLTFRIGRNAKSVTHVKVTLDPTDTYTVRFLKVRSFRKTGDLPVVTELAVVEDVYCDALRAVIERHTGLYLSL